MLPRLPVGALAACRRPRLAAVVIVLWGAVLLMGQQRHPSLSSPAGRAGQWPLPDARGSPHRFHPKSLGRLRSVCVAVYCRVPDAAGLGALRASQGTWLRGLDASRVRLYLARPPLRSANAALVARLEREIRSEHKVVDLGAVSAATKTGAWLAMIMHAANLHPRTTTLSSVPAGFSRGLCRTVVFVPARSYVNLRMLDRAMGLVPQGPPQPDGLYAGLRGHPQQGLHAPFCQRELLALSWELAAHVSPFLPVCWAARRSQSGPVELARCLAARVSERAGSCVTLGPFLGPDSDNGHRGGRERSPSSGALARSPPGFDSAQVHGRRGGQGIPVASDVHDKPVDQLACKAYLEGARWYLAEQADGGGGGRGHGRGRVVLVAQQPYRIALANLDPAQFMAVHEQVVRALRPIQPHPQLRTRPRYPCKGVNQFKLWREMEAFSCVHNPAMQLSQTNAWVRPCPAAVVGGGRITLGARVAVHVLTLAHQEAEFERARRSIGAVAGFGVVRVDGVDGRAKFPDVPPRPAGMTPLDPRYWLTAGELGYRATFRALLLRVLADPPVGGVFGVMDNDVILDCDFQGKLARVLRDPTCGQQLGTGANAAWALLLGATEWGPGVFPLYHRYSGGWNLLDAIGKTTRGLCYSPHNRTLGSFAALLHVNLAPAILDWLRAEPSRPLDHVWSHLAALGYPVRVAYPNLAIADVSHASSVRAVSSATPTNASAGAGRQSGGASSADAVARRHALHRWPPPDQVEDSGHGARCFRSGERPPAGPLRPNAAVQWSLAAR